MAMTGDRIELFKTEPGEEEISDEDEEEELFGLEKEFFDEKSTCHLNFERVNAIANRFPIGMFKGVVPNETLESQLTASGNIAAEDIPGIAKFLRTCLRLTSWKRPIAGDLKEDEWLKPAFACSCGFSGY